MNNGILHGARPSDSMPKGNFGGMPSEVIAMARQMGLTAEDMKQVNSMWKNMDDLAETDPESYKKFTSEIIAEGPPDKGGKPKTFIPTPSFVVKLKTKSDGGVGMKVSTLGGATKFFLNMTSCVAVEPPKDHHGRPVEKYERRNADGLEIPLLVGEVRSCSDHSGDANAALAVDAVFNPWVIESCEDNNTFKAQVIDLALQWVEQETKYLFEKKWKTINSKYKGGLGEQYSMPMPFSVDRALGQSTPIEDRRAATVNEEMHAAESSHHVTGLSTPSPESLLKATLSTEKPVDLVHEIKLPGDSSDCIGARKPLIEEVSPPKEVKPVVKKGFLKPAKQGQEAPRIYDDNGSSGDGMKEGGYSRLMSKCQVVDMSSMSPAEQKKAMEQHAAPSSAPKPTPIPDKQPRVPPPHPPEEHNPSFQNIEKGFLEGKSLGQTPSSSAPKASSDALFDTLISSVDPDYADASQTINDTGEDAVSALGDIAKVLAGQPGMETSNAPVKLMPVCKGLDEEIKALSNKLERLEHTLKIETNPAGLQVASITVKVVPSSASDVDLEVGSSEMRLKVPDMSPLKLPLPFRVDENKTKAKYSKKTESLKISLFEAGICLL